MLHRSEGRKLVALGVAWQIVIGNVDFCSLAKVDFGISLTARCTYGNVSSLCILMASEETQAAGEFVEMDAF